jgi:hypothetical protein
VGFAKAGIHIPLNLPESRLVNDKNGTIYTFYPFPTTGSQTERLSRLPHIQGRWRRARLNPAHTTPNTEDAVRSATQWGSPFKNNDWCDATVIIFNRLFSRKVNRSVWVDLYLPSIYKVRAGHNFADHRR